MTGDDRPTVLVVDDDRSSQAAIRRILEAAGYHIEIAERAEAALERVTHWQPDAFVLDAEMPGIGGVELCWRLREDSRFKNTPILLATANEDRYLLRAAFTAGCDDFLVKPLEPLVVVARLGGLIKKADYYQQLEEIRTELARYVSPRIRKLIEHRVDARASHATVPSLTDVCILFSDIRGFTSLSQAIAPRQLFESVSEHLGVQVDCVYRHRGYVDKFGGDGLMAIFDDATMATDACECGLEILERTSDLPPLDDTGPVPIGVGIHRGPVVVGNIGSGNHLDYTAIGEPVNVAARLCGYAERQDVIVSEAVRGYVGERVDLSFGNAQCVTVRGLNEPILLYHLRRSRAEA